MSNDAPSGSAWQTRQREQVYDNPWIQVSHHQVITPSGQDGIYGVVHFKNLAVGIIALDADDQLWLVRQSRYPLGCHTWELPEGGCPEGEDPLAAAQRELEEEVGLKAGCWRELQRLHLSNSVTDEQAVIFIAQELSAGQQQLEPTEDIQCQKLPFQTALQMIRQGEITDAISVAALLRLALERTS